MIHHYFLEWPQSEAVGASVSQAAPMRLHYVRCHETTVPEQLVEHYRQQFKNALYLPKPSSVWLSDLGVDERSGYERSVDVIVERAGADRPTAASLPQKLSVTVLVVEIPGEGASEDAAERKKGAPKDGSDGPVERNGHR